MRCLADMAHATARLSFATAQANHDLHWYGEWRGDYAGLSSAIEKDYEVADQALDRALQEQRDHKELMETRKKEFWEDLR